MGQGRQLVAKVKPVYFRILFKDAVAKCLGNECVDYQPVISHIADSLYRSLRSSDFFVYDSGGRRLDTPDEMICHADRMRYVGDAGAEYEVRIHTGDYALLMLGMFPGCREVASVGTGIFRDCGRCSYGRAHQIEREVFGQPTDTFEAMADFFPRSVNAIRSMFAGGELLKTHAELQTWIQSAESAPGRW
jgi:hypothetical protein